MDNLSPERRSENMRRIRSKDTSPEMVVRRLAHGFGFRYRLHEPKLEGKPDLVFPRLKKIIDVRGCFWHQHRGCIDSHIPKSRAGYWRPKLQGNVARDKAKTRMWRKAGWEVFIVWDCQTSEKGRPVLKRSLRDFLSG
ncbi:MAG: very short patch repair endonuclease [Bryobacteraceae bacterium]